MPALRAFLLLALSLLVAAPAAAQSLDKVTVAGWSQPITRRRAAAMPRAHAPGLCTTRAS